jgi:CDP-2,3-bis-(O-geranylgeranyl)-sn-glycerol synthase
MHNLLFSLWVFLPAGLANASPVFTKRIKTLHWLYVPIDFGCKYRNKRIFGDNKTWLGIFGGTVVGLLVIALQKYGYVNFEWVRTISGSVNYSQSIIWWLGPLMGFGALAGDAIESFFKRQAGVAAGHAWIPFDQIDYIVGGLVFSALIVRLTLVEYVSVLVVWVILHFVSAYIGYLLGLKSKPI